MIGDTTGIDFMADDGVFMPMLNDTGRNKFYKQALDLSVQDKIVCDIGAGTGLLSVLALQAGAKHVIAVERDPDRFEYLNQNLQKLGLENKIQTRHIDFLDSDIQADVYVSETINTQTNLILESMLGRTLLITSIGTSLSSTTYKKQFTQPTNSIDYSLCWIGSMI